MLITLNINGELETLSPNISHALILMADGMTSTEIAKKIKLHPRTVGYQLLNVAHHLGLKSRDELRHYLKGFVRDEHRQAIGLNFEVKNNFDPVADAAKQIEPDLELKAGHAN